MIQDKQREAFEKKTYGYFEGRFAKEKNPFSYDDYKEADVQDGFVLFSSGWQAAKTDSADEVRKLREEFESQKRIFAKYYDDQTGTPCEHIRHAQEVEILHEEIATLQAEIDRKKDWQNPMKTYLYDRDAVVVRLRSLIDRLEEERNAAHHLLNHIHREVASLEDFDAASLMEEIEQTLNGTKVFDDNKFLHEKISTLEAEATENCRIIGMSAERELALRSQIATLTAQLDEARKVGSVSALVGRLRAQLEKEELSYIHSEGYGDEVYEVESMVSLPDVLGFTGEEYADLLIELAPSPTALVAKGLSEDEALYQKCRCEGGRGCCPACYE